MPESPNNAGLEEFPGSMPVPNCFLVGFDNLFVHQMSIKGIHVGQCDLCSCVVQGIQSPGLSLVGDRDMVPVLTCSVCTATAVVGPGCAHINSCWCQVAVW